MIAESSARLIVNRAAYQTKRDEVLELIAFIGKGSSMRIVDLTARLSLNDVDALLAQDEAEQSVDKVVQGILQDVREREDAALCDYSKHSMASI